MKKFSDIKRKYKDKSVRSVTEVQIETYLVQQCKKAGYRAVKFSDENYDGAPDRIVLGPDAYVAFIELKTSTGRLSEAQKIYLSNLEDKGYYVQVINSKEGVDAFIRTLYIRISDTPTGIFEDI